MKKNLLITLFAVVLWNCSDDPESKPPQTIFEIAVDENYSLPGENNWVIIHDQDGNLLDHKPYAPGDQLVFESVSDPTKVSITFFHTTDATHYVLRTFTGIEPFGTLELQTYVPSTHPSSVVGTGSIMITDPNLGTSLNAILHDGYQGVGGSNTTVGGIPSITFPSFTVRQASNHILSVRDKNDLPRYRYLQNGKTGHQTFSLSDFEYFEDPVDLQFPTTNSFLMMHYAFSPGMPLREENGYLLGQHFGGLGGTTPRSSLMVGYLNDFPSFRTVGVAYYQGYMLGIETAGPRPQSLVVSDIDAEVTDDSFTGFEINSTDDISWLVSIWNLNVGKQGLWSVYSGSLDAKHPREFPEEIYALMSINSINAFDLGALRLQKGNRTYADIIDQRVQASELKPYQEVFKDMSH
jgi:hypothetical protein